MCSWNESGFDYAAGEPASATPGISGYDAVAWGLFEDADELVYEADTGVVEGIEGEAD